MNLRICFSCVCIFCNVCSGLVEDDDGESESEDEPAQHKDRPQHNRQRPGKKGNSIIDYKIHMAKWARSVHTTGPHCLKIRNHK